MNNHYAEGSKKEEAGETKAEEKKEMSKGEAKHAALEHLKGHPAAGHPAFKAVIDQIEKMDDAGVNGTGADKKEPSGKQNFLNGDKSRVESVTKQFHAKLAGK